MQFKTKIWQQLQKTALLNRSDIFSIDRFSTHLNAALANLTKTSFFPRRKTSISSRNMPKCSNNAAGNSSINFFTNSIWITSVLIFRRICKILNRREIPNLNGPARNRILRAIKRGNNYNILNISAALILDGHHHQ